MKLDLIFLRARIERLKAEREGRLKVIGELESELADLDMAEKVLTTLGFAACGPGSPVDNQEAASDKGS